MSKTKFYSKNFFFIVFLFSTSNLVFAEEKKLPVYDLEEEVQNLYLKSFFNKKEEEIEKALREKENEDGEKISFDLNPATINKRNIRALLLDNIVSFDKNWLSDKNVYNKYLVSDLDIYLGKNADPKFNLISKINRTKTVVGELTLATMLARPTTNLPELFKRQQTIKTLIEYKKQQDTIDKILEAYGNIENSVSSLFHERDPFYNSVIRDTIYDNFLFADNSLNTVPWLGHYKMVVRDFGGIFLKTTCMDIMTIVMAGISKSPLSPEEFARCGLASTFFPIVGFFPLFNLADSGEGLAMNGGSLVVFTFPNLFFKTQACNNYEKNDKNLRGIAKRLYSISVLVRLAKKLTEVIEKDNNLKKALGDKIFYLKSLNNKMATDKNLKIIFKFLFEKHEKLRDWHYYRDNAGYILFAYNNLELIKDNIIDAIAEIGVIDAYCSCANLFTEHATKKNHFVFAKFLSSELKKPYLNFQNLWNPFLNPDVAVPNSIEMGDASATKCNTMIITGPNAGGKSTFVNSATLAIVLAQTIGFAPGEEITLTPFHKINSYIEVKDDICDGKSAFVAEVDRSLYQYDILKNLKENEFSFSIFDEPFRGTNPMEGSAVEYSILEKIGQFKNNLNILTTHYPIMTLLEDNNFGLGFRNFKVYITKDEKKNIKFTYKIIPGRSKQNIAINILTQSGYKNEILLNAKKIVKNHKLYETKFDDNKVSQGTW
ncbi:MAG: hypothetical protein LBD32_02225 [Cytophagales bacterium]|jgi:DNA mismatch repair ATPase MutS|nr:hypothetical protein [Cytophagales bacterium]